MDNVSCIIPACNEASRIAGVLKVVEDHPMIGEVIVVDDGSKDNTQSVVAQFPRVKTLRHETNKGKTQAIITGVKEVIAEYILLLDADLTGLTKEAVTALIEPVIHSRADMSIASIHNLPQWWKDRSMDYLSGLRVMPKKLVIDNLRDIAGLPRYGFEVYMDKLAVEHGYRIKTVAWPNVTHPAKSRKQGFWHGVRGEWKMSRDVLKVMPPWGIIRTVRKMKALKVP